LKDRADFYALARFCHRLRIGYALDRAGEHTLLALDPVLSDLIDLME